MAASYLAQCALVDATAGIHQMPSLKRNCCDFRLQTHKYYVMPDASMTGKWGQALTDQAWRAMKTRIEGEVGTEMISYFAEREHVHERENFTSAHDKHASLE